MPNGETVDWSGNQLMVRAFRDTAVDGIARLRSFGCSPPIFTVLVPDELIGSADISRLPERAFFLVEVAAECSGVQVRLTYGDREFEVTTFVRRAEREYELWEWVDVLGGDLLDVTDAMWVGNPNRMDHVVGAAMSTLKSFLPRIRHAGEAVDAELDHRRRSMSKKAADERAKSELKRAIDKARQAFRTRHYDQVVQLLRPHVEYLSAAERRRLEYARTHQSKER